MAFTVLLRAIPDSVDFRLHNSQSVSHSLPQSLSERMTGASFGCETISVLNAYVCYSVTL